MPYRLCLYYGRRCSDEGRCPPGKSRCKAHGGGSWQRVNPDAKARSGAAWQQIRRRVLQQSPMCEKGCGRRARDVDHIIAAADGGSDARSNLRALCNPCHKEHTAEQNRARRKGRQRP